jgi:4-amino-4-deoxy-L-arabinose transferase-like glycosyltransferase
MLYRFLPLAAVLLWFFSFSAYVSLYTPAFEAPDEYYHFAVIEHIARTGHPPPRTLPDPITDYQFPAQPWRQMAFHAPLYYQLMAGLLRAAQANTSDFAAYRLNPHARIGVALAQDNHNLIAHRGGPLWLGVPLADAVTGTGGALRGLRWVSVALATWTLLAIYGFVRAGWPNLPQRAALIAVLIVALMPQYVFLGSVVSNDVLLTALSASGLWLFAWGVRQPRSRWWLPWAAGAIGGTAALTKASGLGAAALLGGLMLVQWGRTRRLSALGIVLIYGLLVLLVAGPWYVNNWLQLGDFTAAEWVARATGLRGDFPVTVDELVGLYWSFWGLLGWFNVALPPIFYLWTLLIVLAAAVGWAQRTPRLRLQRSEALLVVGLIAYSGLIVGAWWQFNQWTLAAQGRLLYPLLPIAAALLSVGLVQHSRGVQVILMSGLALACVSLPIVLSRAYMPSEVVPTPSQGSFTVWLREPWEDRPCVRLTLRVDKPPGEGHADLHLWWQAACPISGYWSVFVHAVDRERQTCEAGQTQHILAQVDTMPQGGRLPLPSVPHEHAAYDYLRIDLPQGATHLHLGLYDAAGTGIRAFVTPDEDWTEGVSTGKCNPELIELTLQRS